MICDIFDDDDGCGYMHSDIVALICREQSDRVSQCSMLSNISQYSRSSASCVNVVNLKLYKLLPFSRSARQRNLDGAREWLSEGARLMTLIEGGTNRSADSKLLGAMLL